MTFRLLLSGSVFLAVVGAARGANCPDAATVVVASVFSTLAVVFLVLGIIAFFLWRRRKGECVFTQGCQMLTACK